MRFYLSLSADSSLLKLPAFFPSAALRMDPADPPGDPAASDPAAGDTDPAGNSTGSEIGRAHV